MAGRFELFTTTVAQISRCIQRIKAREMLRFGLRGKHVTLFFQLSRHGEEGLTAAELCKLCEMDKAAVSRTLAELETLGYVRSSEPGSGRRYRAKLRLTDAGMRIAEKIDRIIFSAVEQAGSGLTEPEREVFYGALQHIARNLQGLAGE